MDTAFVVCDSKEDILHGIALLSEYYKTYDLEDGHKIFLINRGTFHVLVNYKYDGEKPITPENEREVIFGGDDILNELISRKHIELQMSVSRILRGRNSRNACERLINWLLCKEDFSSKNTEPLIGD